MKADSPYQMFSKPVTIDGQQTTAWEAYIRGIHAKALSEDTESLTELERLRRACGVDDSAPAG